MVRPQAGAIKNQFCVTDTDETRSILFYFETSIASLELFCVLAIELRATISALGGSTGHR